MSHASSTEARNTPADNWRAYFPGGKNGKSPFSRVGAFAVFPPEKQARQLLIRWHVPCKVRCGWHATCKAGDVGMRHAKAGGWAQAKACRQKGRFRALLLFYKRSTVVHLNVTFCPFVTSTSFTYYFVFSLTFIYLYGIIVVEDGKRKPKKEDSECYTQEKLRLTRDT